MKKFSQRFLFFVAFSFVLSVISVTAQKNKTSPDDIPSPPPAKVEVKNDPPPAPEPTKSEPSNDSSSSPSYSSSSDPDDIPTPTRNRTERTTIRNERRQRERRARQRADIERRRREAAEEARRNRDKDKDKDDYQNCPNYYIYGDCYNYTDFDSSNGSTPSWGDFYNGNDLYFNNYSFYVDRVTANYSPYFLTTLSANYVPLHRVAVFEQLATVNYIAVAGNWAFYYEPDLDFMHINFEQISQKSKFEKVVINPVGKKTIKRVGKRFKQKRTTRPVVVEDISVIPLDRIYVLNLNRLPKGTYEMKLLGQSGDTIKLPFTIK